MYSFCFAAPAAPLARRACLAIVAAAFPFAASAQSTPYFGSPVPVPNTLQAENFDRGGQGIGHYDLTPGNSGGQYRTTEGVDIITSCDPAAGAYVVTNFQTGEWMKYTINVPVAGSYDIDLRGSSNYGTSAAFHIEVDNVNVTGSVPFANTGGWCAFTWSPKRSVSLSAGTHVLKLHADSQYINVNTLRVSGPTGPISSSSSGGSTPYSGTPVVVPATIEAENFDKGGEGVAYHDNVAGNAGGQYRTSEGVDIIASTDSAGGGYVINNFETGEWLKYTINVPATGNYDLALRTSSNFSTSKFHIEVDGVNVTGSVPVPYTGNWNTFQWVNGKTSLPLSAGNHVLKVVSDAQYFNLNQLRVTASSGSAPVAAPSSPTNAAFFCTFANGATDCGFREQAKVAGRATMVNVGRDGGTAVRLHTEPGDDSVNGSGTWERNDLTLGVSSGYCNEGQDEWWAHSVLFPTDYVFPPGPGAGIVMDFHHNSSSGQANFELQTIPGIGLRLRGYGGPTINGGQYQAVIPDPFGAPVGSVVKNVWYDFVYHIKWSGGSGGKAEAWLNGKKVMTYNGPTLYTGISCYLKLANYHAPFGLPSSVIHDRIVRGTSAAAVALTPLEGVP